jgi:hypothetical protein
MSPGRKKRSELVDGIEGLGHEERVSCLARSVLRQRSDTFVLGEPSGRLRASPTTFADLRGEGRSAKGLEVFRAQAVAKPVAFPFRGPLIRHRF